MLVVNLDHFAGAPTLTARSENENVLKEAVDNLVKAGVCHYILVCFTAYDKYEAYINQTYAGNFFQYLEKELPMFYRSFGVASRTVVRDYTEYDKGQKKVRLECIAVAPVIAQQPTPEINPERFWKPPVGFDVQNSQHSRGIPQIENWLCECEQSERYWDEIECDRIRTEKWIGFLSSAAPTIIGACCGLLVWLLFVTLFIGISIVSGIWGGLFIGVPLGSIVGFQFGISASPLVKNRIRVLTKEFIVVLKTVKMGSLLKKMDPMIRTMDSFMGKFAVKKNEGYEPVIPSGTSTSPSPHPPGAGGHSTTPPPHPSGTGGTAATSGSENFD
jgi:hypothetical protein